MGNAICEGKKGPQPAVISLRGVVPPSPLKEIVMIGCLFLYKKL